jgi:hypothetical protein
MMTVPQRNLITIHEDLPHLEVDKLLANICRTAEIQKVTAQFMDFALIRMIAAASVAEARFFVRSAAWSS